jgi:hypothetical protein
LHSDATTALLWATDAAVLALCVILLLASDCEGDTTSELLLVPS